MDVAVITVKKLRKPAKQNSSVGKFETSGPQNSRCGKCCQVLATKTLSRGYVLSQSTFHLVNVVVSTGRLVIVDIDTFQLDVLVADVGASRINAVFVRDHFPELHHISRQSHTRLDITVI